jgi:hypothetical protein
MRRNDTPCFGLPWRRSLDPISKIKKRRSNDPCCFHGTIVFSLPLWDVSLMKIGSKAGGSNQGGIIKQSVDHSFVVRCPPLYLLLMMSVQ